MPIRRGSSVVRHALLMYDADDQQVNGTASGGDQDEACRLAQSTLRLTPGVAYILIYVCDAWGNLAPQPLKRVDWDQEW